MVGEWEHRRVRGRDGGLVGGGTDRRVEGGRLGGWEAGHEDEDGHGHEYWHGHEHGHEHGRMSMSMSA